MRHCELGKKWLVDFNTGKTELFSFDWCKWMGLFLRKNHLLGCWADLLLNWTGALILSLLEP